MPNVARFNLTPLKSTQLIHPESITLTAAGVAGDRSFLFVDPAGKRFSGEAKAGLLGITATYEAGPDRLTLGFPDGHRVSGPAAPMGAAFSVSLSDREIQVREVPGPLGEEAGRHLGRTARLVRTAGDARAGGLPPVSIISGASIRDVGSRGGTTALDPRRFRMLIELDGCEPYEEDEWQGQRLRVGAATLRVMGPTLRCKLTTMNPDTGERDFPTLDVLAAYRRTARGLELGRYAAVETPGVVRVGDPVTVVPIASLPPKDPGATRLPSVGVHRGRT